MRYSQTGRWRGVAGLTISAIAALGFTAAAIAADIEVTPPKKANDSAFIMIDGEIKSGDDEKFRKIAAEYADAIVLLNSEGGMIGPAMDIGRTIKLRGYGTAIYKTGSCASACALMWVAGSKRVVFEGGQVGFHASYLDTDGRKLATGVGNALVGHYLSQLGFGEKTVVFATLAPPEKILWLNDKTASMSGIEYTVIPDEEIRSPSQVTKRQSTPPRVPVPVLQQEDATDDTTAGYQPYMGDAKQTVRTPEAFVTALRQKGYQAKISHEIEGIPMIMVNVGGEEIGIGFSDCNNDGCNYIQLMDWFIGVTEDEAYSSAGGRLAQEGYSHPYWNKDNKTFSLYNYIVIGSDGITVQNLIDNMNYFVRDNVRITDLILQRRSKD